MTATWGELAPFLGLLAFAIILMVTLTELDRRSRK